MSRLHRCLLSVSLIALAQPAFSATPAAGSLDRSVLPIAEPKIKPITELDARKAKPPPRFEVKAPKGAPNVVIVLIDDLGFGATSTFGGPIATPTLDRLAQGGLRYNNFHTTALCSPTRAALKSGRNHHTGNMGFITEMATGFPGATGQIPNAVGAAGRNAAPERLQHRRPSASGTRPPPGRSACPVPSTAGRPTRASTSSTASSAARPTSGHPSCTTA